VDQVHVPPNEVKSPFAGPLARRVRGSIERRQERLAWLMLAPVILALLGLGVYPFVSTIWLSFLQGGFFGEGMSFAGFANYTQLFHDLQFWGAFRFSILYSIITVAGQMVLGTLLALFANLKFPGRWLVRAAILFPWAIPTASNSVMWAYMFNDQYGLINSVAERLGLMNPAHAVIWLGSANSATALIWILAIWKANSLVALLVLAGLQVIPGEVYEAARVDGANAWRTFWHVTLPLLVPTLTVTLILRTIESLQAFDLISAFTNGGPGNATQNLGLYIYVQMQQYGAFGYGSSIAVVVMVLTLAFILFYLRTLYRPAVQ
jgi:ABC-type sugar transport system permease subunit